MTQTDPIATTRRILSRVRDVMAGSGEGQERLDGVVGEIAGGMGTEVCSVYVRRPGDMLELFATRGLRPDAVHHTHLRISEGLVGTIAAKARPMAFDDVRNHPDFAFRPQTGEEVFDSLMGVPILRDGRVVGVLVVQSRESRAFADEETEALETVAMVLAEMIGAGDLVSRADIGRSGDTTDAFHLPQRIEGVSLGPGLGMGVAVLHQPTFILDDVVAEDTALERKRLDAAMTEMQGALDAMLASDDLDDAGEHREILDTYRLIAEDAGWVARIEEAIESGLTAEAAVQKVQNDIRARMAGIEDDYIRERMHDFDDLAHRLLQHLLGPVRQADLPENAILVARSMGPAELLDYDRVRIKGLVLEEGSATSHAAIVARALDIPVVGRAGTVLSRLDPGDQVIVDGDGSQVLIRPGEDVLETFEENLAARAQRKAEWAMLRDKPAESLDGQRIDVRINAGLLADLGHLDEWGADGIGLYRTEIPFMVRSEFPDVEAQRKLYGRILDGVGGRPVAFRTLDLGGDKDLPYWPRSSEENPAMGWRAIRVSLDRPAVLVQQLTALIRAAAGKELRVMFPMVSEVVEFDEARKLLDDLLENAQASGAPTPTVVLAGVMLEVPALALQIEPLLERVDFVSIGSNDLLQFMFASDRNNPLLADRYDPLSPAALGFLGSVVARCDQADVPVTICGEMAGRPLECMALIGLGVRRISIPPTSVGPIKAMIRGLYIPTLEEYLHGLMSPTRRSVRSNLRAFARDHNVLI